MSQKDLESSLETIKKHLKFDDDNGKATSLSNLKSLLSKNTIYSLDLVPIVDLLEEIYMERNDILILDVIEVACIIGKQDFKLIRNFFQHLKNQLKFKNRYYIVHLLDFISKYISSNICEIEEVIKDLLENGLVYFDRPDLKKMFKNFWNEVANQGFGFISKYKDHISSNLPIYKEEAPEIEQIFSENLVKYQVFLDKERARKHQIAQQLENDIITRKNLREKRLNLMEKVQKTQNQENERNGDEIILSETNEDEFDASKKPSSKENPNFISFSSMGLKKKKKE